MIDFDLQDFFEECFFGDGVSIKKVPTDFSKFKRFIDFYGVDYKFRDHYYALLKSEEVLMTTDIFEVLTNQYFWNNAKGDILIFGLGLGWIVFPLLHDDRVKSIKIIEKNIDIINFIGEKLKKEDLNNKVTIINGDLYNWYKIDNSKYDFIYFDIYNTPQESVIDKENIEPLYNSLLRDGGISYFWAWEVRDLLF